MSGGRKSKENFRTCEGYVFHFCWRVGAYFSVSLYLKEEEEEEEDK
jgi:hypothetical protein